MEGAHSLGAGRERWFQSSGRRWLTFGPAAILIGVGAVALVLTSDFQSDRVVISAIVLSTAWAFVAAGLFAWSREPENRIGPLMVATGYAWFLAALSASHSSTVFTIGLVVFPLSYALLVHLLLAYPSGRLSGRADVVVVVLAYLAASVLRIPWLLFETFPSEACADCPPNRLRIADEPTLADAFTALTSAIALGAVIYVAVRLVQRWRAGSPRARRALAPVLLAGVGFLVGLVALLVLELTWLGGARVAQWFLFAFLLSVPIAFLVGLLRSRLATAEVSRFLRDAPASATPEEAQEGLRRALGDPTLELAYWLPERSEYVDVAGNPYALPPEGGDRMTTPIAYEDRPVGALVHDGSLRHEPELVEAVVAAARVTLEKDRLGAELRARLDELQGERDFIRTVIDSSPAFFCVLDLDGAIVGVNRTGLAMTGHGGDDAVRGLPFWDAFVAADEREAVRGRLLAADETGGSEEVETTLVTTSGGRLVLAWSCTPLTNAEGVPRLLVSGIDVTERKHQEEELRASRARLVEAADTERRRLERNLHDGAQQRLVTLSLTLRLAEARLPRDADADAVGLLRGARDELGQALDELRDLARGIHPAVLSDHGLSAALDGLASRVPLPVEIELGVDERLPEPVEVAAYYLVAESLANVQKYADATTVRIGVAREDGVALVEVRDDGVGGADSSSGSGLRGLADRVEALDGRLEVVSVAGAGTTVRARIPCR